MPSQNIPMPEDVWFCSRCNSMLSTIEGLQALTSADGYEHFGKVELDASAQNGCSLCIMIYNQMNFNTSSQYRETLRLFLQKGKDKLWKKRKEHEDYPLTGLLFESLSGWLGSLWKFDLIAFTSEDEPSSTYTRKRPLVSDVACDTVYKKWIERLDECRKKHRNCPPCEEAALPTRVVEVGDCEDNSQLKLHVKGGIERYAALSYCWGMKMKESLTIRSNLRDRTRHLDYDVLPTTIQDAITVVRKLGIRFLWVDALCILQDDDEDKAKEISAMGFVYKRATVTISAANAKCAADGFLSPRSPQFEQVTLPLILPNDKYSNISLTPVVGAYNPRNPLESRGWTLQEYLLSPRVLVYGRDEATWHCQTKRFLPISPNWLNYVELVKQLPAAIFYEKPDPSKSELDRFKESLGKYAYNPDSKATASTVSLPKNIRSKLDREGKKLFDRHDFWRRIVGDFSRRRLSYQGDRLSALAGVAQELARAWKDTYVAGLWQSNLLSDLVWYRPRSSTTEPEETGCAPSWSWASLSSPAQFRNMRTMQAKIIECKIVPTRGEALFGSVKTGTLLIQGKLMDGSQESKATTEKWEFYYDRERDRDRTDQFYLLLGHNGTHLDDGSLNHFILVLCPTGPERFRRIGLAHKVRGARWSFVKETIVEVL